MRQRRSAQRGGRLAALHAKHEVDLASAMGIDLPRLRAVAQREREEALALVREAQAFEEGSAEKVLQAMRGWVAARKRKSGEPGSPVLPPLPEIVRAGVPVLPDFERPPYVPDRDWLRHQILPRRKRPVIVETCGYGALLTPPSPSVAQVSLDWGSGGPSNELILTFTYPEFAVAERGIYCFHADPVFLGQVSCTAPQLGGENRLLLGSELILSTGDNSGRFAVLFNSAEAVDAAPLSFSMSMVGRGHFLLAELDPAYNPYHATLHFWISPNNIGLGSMILLDMNSDPSYGLYPGDVTWGPRRAAVLELDYPVPR